MLLHGMCFKEEKMAVLEGLKPEKVFEFFEMLCSVPHGSGNTKQISDLCVKFAKDRGLRCQQDALNNVIIWKDATPGYESVEPLIFQGHIDMVCASEPDCGFDMKQEGPKLYVDGDWVKARKTSLGADNGIGVAIAMALLDDDTLRHPRLEALFTTDEETGMFGANGVDLSVLEGHNLINLDSEEEGYLTVSCAGGVRADTLFPAEWEKTPADWRFYEVVVQGLKGGHSGAEINKGRANAIRLAGRFLLHAEKQTGLRIASMEGGTFTNVIPLYCRTVAAVPADHAARFEELCRADEEIFRDEYEIADPGLTMKAAPVQAAEKVFSAARTKALLRMLNLAPNGVQAMSMYLPGLVQTSLNLGVVKTEAEGIGLYFSLRSSFRSQKDVLAERLEELCGLLGASFSTHDSYPAWAYKTKSRLRDAVSDACTEILGLEPSITATHGGLECGLFMEKRPDFDCVSLGPEIHEVHSVRERLSISSTQRLYDIMRCFVENWK